MTIFSAGERAYLDGQQLGRLATVDRKGQPQANAVGFAVRDDGSVDIGGFAMGTTKKWRNIAGNPLVSLVVDDVVSRQPWVVRGIEIRGEAEQVVGAHDLGAHFGPEVIRIRPRRVIAWGLEGGEPGMHGRTVSEDALQRE
ncbi:PPOX class F420-dependent oxidoreductase [Streptomyces sp. H39-S7]|uniref:PPOX class F420-dependent oxidoreductase n=1 Tax=Streptomyces sp. H39-S7 TaxID=3004357 RepID=UPI0022AF45F4|nr:PPOX class F420-dependent oxidoreductase [Streptomyces sp. H39-S7]MCZ4124486.1 PPOX class F420-dependent oxidoreductase [Streptomyces sp. H39-S7]